MDVAVTRKQPRIFYGWWIVLTAAALNTYAGGVWFYGFSAFFKPIVDEFGWTYAVTSLAFSLYQLESGVLAPVVGYLVDRLGPRKLVFFGTTVVGFGLILLSRVDSLLTFYGTFLLISIGFGAGAYLPGLTAIANWFVRKRGTAMGFLLAGYGASGLLVPGLVWLISMYGWRQTLFFLGIGMWIMGLPAGLIIRHRPEPYGYLPDGDSPPPQTGESSGRSGEEAQTIKSQRPPVEGLSAREAMRTPAFWFLSIGVSLAMMGTSGLVVHEIPYLGSVGIPAQTAALAITAMTSLSIVGRLSFGWLGDRFERRFLLMGAYGLQLIGMLFFAFVTEAGHLIPFLLIFGPAYGGAISLRPAILADYFGIRSYATIQGFSQLVMMWPGLAGPVLAGWMYDTMGSYRLAFIIFAVVTLLGLPLIFMARPPRAKNRSLARP